MDFSDLRELINSEILGDSEQLRVSVLGQLFSAEGCITSMSVRKIGRNKAVVCSLNGLTSDLVVPECSVSCRELIFKMLGECRKFEVVNFEFESFKGFLRISFRDSLG